MPESIDWPAVRPPGHRLRFLLILVLAVLLVVIFGCRTALSYYIDALWFGSLGYDCALGSEISPDGARPLRESVTEPALAVSLRAAIERLNPTLPATTVDDVLRQAVR